MARRREYWVPSMRMDDFWAMELQSRHIDFLKVDVDTSWKRIGLEGLLLSRAFTVGTPLSVASARCPLAVIAGVGCLCASNAWRRGPKAFVSDRVVGVGCGWFGRGASAPSPPTWSRDGSQLVQDWSLGESLVVVSDWVVEGANETNKV